MIAACFAGLVTIAWSVAAVLAAGRGFDGANEAGYLLAFRHWDTNPRTFTIVQYVLGPLFELLGYDVARLRVVRVLLLLAAHAWFGWAFMRWLRRRRPDAPQTLWWEAAGTLLVIASAGLVLGWLPLTPSYNDIVLECALGLMAVVLLTSVRVADGGAPAVWLAAVAGLLSALAVLSKLTTVVLVVVVVVALLAVGGRRPAHVARTIGGLVAGAVAFVAYLAALQPLDETFDPLLETLGVIAEFAHQPSELALDYTGQLLVMLGVAGLLYALPLGALAYLGSRVSWRIRTRVLATVAVAGGLCVWAGAWVSGHEHVGAYIAFVVGLLLLGLLAGITAFRRSSGQVMVLVLLALPFLQAAGTGNNLLTIAISGVSFWVAGLIWVLTSWVRMSEAVPSLVASCLGLIVLVCGTIGVHGAWHEPNGNPLHTRTTPIGDRVPLLAGIELPDPTVEYIRLLQADLAEYVEPAGRTMIAYGEIGEHVVYLNGLPVGETWFSIIEDGLQAADLRAACRSGNPWGDRQPLIFTVRELTSREAAAYPACGLDLEHDYVEADLRDPIAGLRVLVPRP